MPYDQALRRLAAYCCRSAFPRPISNRNFMSRSAHNLGLLCITFWFSAERGGECWKARLENYSLTLSTEIKDASTLYTAVFRWPGIPYPEGSNSKLHLRLSNFLASEPWNSDSPAATCVRIKYCIVLSMELNVTWPK